MKVLSIAVILLTVALALPLGAPDATAHSVRLTPAMLPSTPLTVSSSSAGAFGLGSVVNTLVLSNSTLLSGNYVPTQGIGLNPAGIAFDPSNGLLFVADQGIDMVSGPQYVSVVSPTLGKVVDSIPVGIHPIGVAYDPLDKSVYVTNMGSNNVSIIDATTLRSVGSIPVGTEPWGIAVDSRSGNLYVANYGSNNVSVISTATNQVIDWIGMSLNPVAIAYDDGNRQVYVTNAGSNDVAVVNSTTEQVVKWVTAGETPDALAYDPQNGNIYVANQGEGYLGGGAGGWNVTIINGSTDSFAGGIWGMSYPRGIVYDPVNGDIYVVNQGGFGPLEGSVSVIDTANKSVVAQIANGTAHPVEIAFDSQTSNLYVTNLASHVITVVNGSRNTVTGVIVVGTTPYGITYASSQGTFFVSNYDAGNVVAFQASTNRVIGWAGVGSSPEGLAYDNHTGNIYVTNFGGTNVSVLSASGLSSIANVSVGDWPSSATSDGGRGHILISNVNNVSILNTSTNSVVAWPSLNNVNIGGAAYDQANGFYYVASESPSNNPNENGSLIAIDDSNFQVGSYVTVGERPQGVAYDNENQFLYVANSGSATVSVVSGTSNRLVKTLPVVGDPTGIAYDPVNGFLYVCDSQFNQVTVINGSSNQVVGSLTVGSDPLNAAIDPANGAVLITNLDTGTISIISPYITPQVTAKHPSNGFLGLPGYDGYVLVGAAITIAAAMLIVVWISGRRDRSSDVTRAVVGVSSDHPGYPGIVCPASCAPD